MSDADPPDSPPNENAADERLRERLDTDDSAGDPLSEEAIIDADAIGVGLREDG